MVSLFIVCLQTLISLGGVKMQKINADITDMQCRLFRMAEMKWHKSPQECADIFKKYDIMGFIDECYDSLHLNSYQCALDDIELLLKNSGVKL